MALATQGSVIKPKYQNSLLNSLQPKTSLSTPAPAQQTYPQSVAPLKVQTGAGINQTVQQDAQGNKYAAPKSNPNVLAQQKALNKLGARLVEDGIAGDKTRAAIAQYGGGGTSTGTTSGVIKPTTTTTGTSSGMINNTQTEQRDSKGLLVNPVGAQFDRNTGQKIVTPPEPPKIDTQSNAERVIGAGQQTQNEKDTQAGLLNSGGITDWEKEVKNGSAVDKANADLAKFRQDVAREFSEISTSGIPMEFQQGRKQALSLQFAQQEAALQSALSNALTNQGQQFGAAATQAGRGLSAAGTAYSGAQAQAGRAQGGAGTVFGAGLVSPTTPGQAAFSGLSGYQGGSANQFGNPNDPASQSNYQSYIKAVNDNNAISVASTTFNSNFDKAISDAKQVNSILTPDQKNTPIEKLLQLITNGVLGTSPVLSALVNDITAIKNSYKQATGNDLIIPPTATLDQLNTIKSSAQSAIKAAQQGNQQLIDKYSSSSKKSSDSSTGESASAGGYNFKMVNGKWVPA